MIIVEVAERKRETDYERLMMKREWNRKLQRVPASFLIRLRLKKSQRLLFPKRKEREREEDLSRWGLV